MPELATSHPANDNRPAEFDAELLKWIPGLRGHASTRHWLHDTDDLTQSTVVWALANWHSKPAQIGTYPWLKGVMANVANKRRATRAIERNQVIDAPVDSAEPASQEHATELRQVMELLAPRDATIMAHMAAGYTLQEIGAAEGVSIERIRQIVARARERLSSALCANTRRALVREAA